MKTPIVGRGLLAVAFFAAWSVATGASAGVFRAFLSSTGNDANPCSLTAPCRLLPAALAAVVDGGRITLLDSANYNTGTVTITKSVTIDANPGGSAGVAAISGDAIFVNTAGVKVTLRNLVILNYGGGTNGIEFAQGAQLNVENCEISNMINAGIQVTASSSNVTAKNTELRSNYVGFWAIGTTNATLDGVSIHDNNFGVATYDGAHVTVAGSTIANTLQTAMSVSSSSGSSTVLVVAHSTISGAPGTYGIAITADTGKLAEAFVEANVMHVGYGFLWGGFGGTETIYSSGDNRLVFYNAGTFGGSLQSLAGI